VDLKLSSSLCISLLDHFYLLLSALHNQLDLLLSYLFTTECGTNYIKSNFPNACDTHNEVQSNPRSSSLVLLRSRRRRLPNRSRSSRLHRPRRRNYLRKYLKSRLAEASTFGSRWATRSCPRWGVVYTCDNSRGLLSSTMGRIELFSSRLTLSR
jgi:hypothetical protein